VYNDFLHLGGSCGIGPAPCNDFTQLVCPTFPCSGYFSGWDSSFTTCSEYSGVGACCSGGGCRSQFYFPNCPPSSTCTATSAWYTCGTGCGNPSSCQIDALASGNVCLIGVAAQSTACSPPVCQARVSGVSFAQITRVLIFLGFFVISLTCTFFLRFLVQLA
jgi:hypothetical protein